MIDNCRQDECKRLECCEQECRDKCVKECYCNDCNNANGGNGILLLFLLILVYCLFCNDGRGGLFGGLFQRVLPCFFMIGMLV